MRRNTFADSDRLFKTLFTETYNNCYAITCILLSLRHKGASKLNKIKMMNLFVNFSGIQNN